MRYRALSANGDYVFGAGKSEFLVDSPAAVAQAVRTRLLLAEGEWFLDQDEGTPYQTLILGAGTEGTYDAALQNRIVETPGVLSLDEYASQVDGNTRKLTVSCLITTEFGQAAVQLTL